MKDIYKRFKLSSITAIFDIILRFVSFVTIIFAFVPFSPIMPGNSTDSWIFGIDQTITHGLSFGKDVIFTYGPYASIYTRTYNPSSYFYIFFGSLFLGLIFFGCFLFLTKNNRWGWLSAFIIIFLGLFSRDALLFSIPLIIGLVILKIQLLDKPNLENNKLLPLFVSLLFVSLGLLPLIKGSLILLCVLVAILCSALFFINKQKFLGSICLFVPAISMIFFWIASGQSLPNLLSYFQSMSPIVSGYTEAMAVNGFFPILSVIEIILYFVTSIILLFTIGIQKQITKFSKIFLFCLYLIFLFISFKAGFVRDDTVHALISGSSILIGALLLEFIFNIRIIYISIIFAFVTWSSIFCHYTCGPSIKELISEHKLNLINISRVVAIEFIQQFSSNVGSNYSSGWQGILNDFENKNWIGADYNKSIISLQKTETFPALKGTTDIYTYDLKYFVASPNEWSMRPIFHSYSVYTPLLAEINREHLISEQAPDNIIFKVESIDDRIPSIEDGASWPIFMMDYQSTQMKNDYLFLQKKENVNNDVELVPIASGEHNFGEAVVLPNSNQPIFVQIKIEPTILGRIANIIFKPTQLHVSFELKDGTKKQYRIIAGMSESGFLISPLIENTEEFNMLYNKKDLLDKKLVKSLTIDSDLGWLSLWNKNYNIVFSQIKPI